MGWRSEMDPFSDLIKGGCQVGDQYSELVLGVCMEAGHCVGTITVGIGFIEDPLWFERIEGVNYCKWVRILEDFLSELTKLAILNELSHSI